MKITHPVKSCLPSKSGGYAFIITDANNVEHYFTNEGTYDGFSSGPCVDGQTGSHLN